jgi:hypothetical protein
MTQQTLRITKGLLLAGIFTAGALVLNAQTQTQAAASADKSAAAPAATPTPAAAPTRFEPPRTAKKAVAYYGSVWGVEDLSVKLVESGEIVRFTYHVIDAERAKPLNDKKVQPSLIDPRAGVSLVVPSLEKVGQLRQSSTPEAGKSYWMAFSNNGRLVKRGDRVIVVIGQFKAEGLIVE